MRRTITADVPIDSIDVDRIPLQHRVVDLARAMVRGEKMPPIHVALTDTGFVVCDGRHTLAAARLLGRRTIRASFAWGRQ